MEVWYAKGHLVNCYCRWWYVGQTLYGLDDEMIILSIISVASLSSALYYRYLWKAEKIQKENMAKTLKAMEWWGE